MFLSSEAKKLLDENRIEELQALTFEQLVHPSVFTQYQQYCRDPLTAIPDSMSSVPDDLADPISLDVLQDAVVVSSGHIYSQATILMLWDKMVDGVATFLCPQSREVLNINCFGMTEPMQSFIRLPQIDEAVAEFERLYKTRLTTSAVRLSLGPAKQTGMGFFTAMALSSPPDEPVRSREKIKKC